MVSRLNIKHRNVPRFELVVQMPQVQVPTELMRKIHALLKASKHDCTLPPFKNEEELVQMAVRRYLAEHAIVSLS